jgi:hypothetical protein
MIEIGADLFAMSAACSRAHTLRVSSSPEDRSRSVTAVALADTFCTLARRRIEARYDAVFDNDDVEIYETAQRVMSGEVDWLERVDG